MASPLSRIPKAKLQVVISPATPADLPALVRTTLLFLPFSFADVRRARNQVEGEWAAFPETYEHVEPPSLRPAHGVRLARTVTRKLEVLKHGGRMMKATLPETGEIIGAALWHVPGWVGPNLQRWREGDDAESWEGVDTAAWEALFAAWEDAKKRVMPEEKNWCV